MISPIPSDLPQASAGRGRFVLSLDFELSWGFRDRLTPNRVHDRLLRTREAIPRILDLFVEFEIHATWAVVGFLFFKTRQELLDSLPGVRPRYRNSRYCPYEEISDVRADERSDPYRLAGSLVDLISRTPSQEIATHTFSHFYCLEDGQDRLTFEADLDAAIRVAESRGMQIRSIVLPRNQINYDYLESMARKGIIAYRGNEESWLYRERKRENESRIRRLLRLVDSYIPLTGDRCFSADSLGHRTPLNVRASRFLRPYSRRLRFAEPLKMRRIERELTHAAKRGLVYHLWRHPHNFGEDTEKELGNLRRILQLFAELRSKYAMRSVTMSELVDEVHGSRQ